MTDRHTADSITSDALDQLYAHIATLEHVAAGNKRHVQLIVPDLQRAEAALARVQNIADEHPAGIDTALIWEALDDTHRPPTDAQRVMALYEAWVKAGPPPLGVSLSRWWDRRLVELHEAILPPAEQPERTTANNPGKDQ